MSAHDYHEFLLGFWLMVGGAIFHAVVAVINTRWRESGSGSRSYRD